MDLSISVLFLSNTSLMSMFVTCLDGNVLVAPLINVAEALDTPARD